MPRDKIPITLYGAQADRFEEIRDELEDEYGYEPKRPQVVAELMKQW